MKKPKIKKHIFIFFSPRECFVIKARTKKEAVDSYIEKIQVWPSAYPSREEILRDLKENYTVHKLDSEYIEDGFLVQQPLAR